MAITKADVLIWFKLADEGKIPADPDVLELGEAEWYGDYHLSELFAIIEKYAKPGDRENLAGALKSIFQDNRSYNSRMAFVFAKLFYMAMLRYNSMTSIDLGGTDTALKLDLNFPVAMDKKFDVIINTGTIEHLFEASQGFRTCHDLCKPAGLMFHAFPFQGWLDHGFWNMNPTLLVDLAAANKYKQEICVYFELETGRVEWIEDNPVRHIHAMAKENSLGKNTLLYTVWRKQNDGAFVIPRQGHYAKTLDPESQKDWDEFR